MNNSISNNVIKQVILLLLTGFLAVIIIWQLAYFIPGFLGATAIYVMFRSLYFRLVGRHKWKASLAALAIIIGVMLTMVVPLYFIGQVLSPKIQQLISNSDEIKKAILTTYSYIREKFPQIKITNEQIMSYAQKVIVWVPTLFTATMHLLANLFTALFIAYFFFVGGKKLESNFRKYVPLERASRDELWSETKNLVISSAVGIPVLALAQGLIAMVGYWVCGVEGFVLWGVMTGVASIIPVVGTMVVWVPVCIYLFAQGNVTYGIGLTLYCLIVVGLSDNVVRFAFLKKFGDVHPLVTVFGVILGLNLFGIVGLIFGPLLLSYLMILVRVYTIEFGKNVKDA